MNINPFQPSEMNSKLSYDNLTSHSSFSKEGREIVFTMKESLRDLDSFNLSPEKTPIYQTFHQSFSPTLENVNGNSATKKNKKLLDMVQQQQLEEKVQKFGFENEENEFIHGLNNSNTRHKYSLSNLRHTKNIHSTDNLQGSFGPAETGSNWLGFAQGIVNNGSENQFKTHANQINNVLDNSLGIVNSSFSLSNNDKHIKST